MFQHLVRLFLLLLFLAPVAGAQTRLLRQPALGEKVLVFVYAGDLWVANHDGSDPRRLTSHPAEETMPYLSSDGTRVAYTANYEGNEDVYVIKTTGGQPQRMTWHPGRDRAVGWSADGEAVLFNSSRENEFGRTGQLYRVPMTGGAPTRVMRAPVAFAAYSPGGGTLAYTPFNPAYNALYGGASGWRLHRGGQTPYLNLLSTATGAVRKLDGRGANNLNPFWVGNELYFLSDRDGVALNVYHQPLEGEARPLTSESPWDVRWASGHGQQIAFESGGQLKLLNLTDGQIRTLELEIHPDLPQLRAGWRQAGRTIESLSLSPTGKRVILTARGEVFTVPTDKGSTRNLTRSESLREYTGVWSPLGDKVAWIEDDGQVQRIVIADQTGAGEARRYPLGADLFAQLLQWTADGRRLILEDNHLHLKALDVQSGSLQILHRNPRRSNFLTTGSPDGRWLAYTRSGENFNHSLVLHDFQTGTTYPVFDSQADISSVAFDHSGKLLFFVASTNAGPRSVGLDMSSLEQPVRSAIYLAVLDPTHDSPLKEDSGDETRDKGDKKPASPDSEANSKESKKVSVVPSDLYKRVEALPLPERFYDTLLPAHDGSLYYIQRVQPGSIRSESSKTEVGENKLVRFDFKERDEKAVLGGVLWAGLSHDGKHLLVKNSDNKILHGKAAKEFKPKSLSLEDVKVFIRPTQEWAQILRDVYRMEREYFYDPRMHGLEWDTIYQRYAALLPHVGRREDLNDLILEMIGELQVGHNYAGGGDVYREATTKSGLLGANFEIVNGKYRLAKIFTGETWNPFLKAPLAGPGIDAKVGDLIVAIDGEPLDSGDNIFERLQRSAGKQVTLTLTSSAEAKPRVVTVEPISDEEELRLWNWVEENRRKVDKATGGRVAYVYLPNTTGAGYRFFNRMFFAQAGRDAVIIDERANGGGQAANYILDVLNRPYLSGWRERDGQPFNTPGGAIYGPKVMLIDQDAGSGGDYLPYMFKQMNLGTLVGTRTWGGLIGISANPRLIDGGFLTVPFFRFYNPKGEWAVENHGTSPDISVILDPEAYNQGRDVQLERAIEITLQKLQNYRPVDLKQAPTPPDKPGK